MRNIFVVTLLLVIGPLTGCRSVAPPVPLEQLSAQQARGHAVFQTRCGICHYDRKDAALHGPSLLGIYKKSSLPSGAAATDERVTATIQNGHGLMPPMGDLVEPADLGDLLAYLHTL